MARARGSNALLGDLQSTGDSGDVSQNIFPDCFPNAPKYVFIFNAQAECVSRALGLA
jgi:hypothetical protein